MKLNEYGVTKLNEQNILAKTQKKVTFIKKVMIKTGRVKFNVQKGQ